MFTLRQITQFNILTAASQAGMEQCDDELKGQSGYNTGSIKTLPAKAVGKELARIK